jgi:alpha/beta hydrolase fold
VGALTTPQARLLWPRRIVAVTIAATAVAAVVLLTACEQIVTWPNTLAPSIETAADGGYEAARLDAVVDAVADSPETAALPTGLFGEVGTYTVQVRDDEVAEDEGAPRRPIALRRYEPSAKKTRSSASEARSDSKESLHENIHENLLQNAPIVLFSHGGDGATTGHLGFPRFATTLASTGALSVVLNHLPSGNESAHLRDRPADIRRVIGQLRRTGNRGRVAVVGHSWGAHTAYAVAGATFEHGTFRDERVEAIVALSPQGPGLFGGYDRGRGETSWTKVAIPTLNIVGELEKDASVSAPVGFTDWRLWPYRRSRAANQHLYVLPGAGHDATAGGDSSFGDFVQLVTLAFLRATQNPDLNLACLERAANSSLPSPSGVIAEHRFAQSCGRRDFRAPE